MFSTGIEFMYLLLTYITELMHVIQEYPKLSKEKETRNPQGSRLIILHLLVKTWLLENVRNFMNLFF